MKKRVAVVIFLLISENINCCFFTLICEDRLDNELFLSIFVPFQKSVDFRWIQTRLQTLDHQDPISYLCYQQSLRTV